MDRVSSPLELVSSWKPVDHPSAAARVLPLLGAVWQMHIGLAMTLGKVFLFYGNSQCLVKADLSSKARWHCHYSLSVGRNCLSPVCTAPSCRPTSCPLISPCTQHWAKHFTGIVHLIWAEALHRKHLPGHTRKSVVVVVVVLRLWGWWEGQPREGGWGTTPKANPYTILSPKIHVDLQHRPALRVRSLVSSQVWQTLSERDWGLSC